MLECCSIVYLVVGDATKPSLVAIFDRIVEGKARAVIVLLKDAEKHAILEDGILCIASSNHNNHSPLVTAVVLCSKIRPKPNVLNTLDMKR